MQNFRAEFCARKEIIFNARRTHIAQIFPGYQGLIPTRVELRAFTGESEGHYDGRDDRRGTTTRVNSQFAR